MTTILYLYCEYYTVFLQDVLYLYCEYYTVFLQDDCIYIVSSILYFYRMIVFIL